MQVAEGIHKVEGARVANVRLVEIEDGLPLVDAGAMLGTLDDEMVRIAR